MASSSHHGCWVRIRLTSRQLSDIVITASHLQIMYPNPIFPAERLYNTRTLWMISFMFNFSPVDSPTSRCRKCRLFHMAIRMFQMGMMGLYKHSIAAKSSHSEAYENHIMSSITCRGTPGLQKHLLIANSRDYFNLSTRLCFCHYQLIATTCIF